MRIAFAGHLSIDVNVVKGTPQTVYGGGVVYGGIAAARLGAEVTVYTKCRAEDREHFSALDDAGVRVVLFPSETSTSIRNDYPTDNPDDRTCHLISRAEPFCAADLEQIEADVLHINPLTLGEFPPELIPLARERAEVLGTDAQGFLRVVGEDGGMRHQDWRDKATYLPHIDLFKVDVNEAETLTGFADPERATRRLFDLGVGTILYTHAEGVQVFDGTRLYGGRFGPYGLEGRTGRGDTCTAAYLVARESEAPAEAVEEAAAVTSAKMQYPGPFRGNG